MLYNQNNNIQPQVNLPPGSQNILNYKEITILDTLQILEKTIFIRFRSNRCSCTCGPQGIKGKMNYFLSMSIVSLIFSIFSIGSSFNFCPEYKELRNLLLLKLDEEGTSLIKSLWCDLNKYQNCVVIIIFVFISLFFVFEIIQKKYYNTIIQEEKQQGKITIRMIIINYIFNFIFKYLVAIAFLFSIYEIIIICTRPMEFERTIPTDENYSSYSANNYEKSEEEKWFDELYIKCLIFGIVNSIILFLMAIFIFILCFIDELIYIYLDLNFENNKKFAINNMQYTNNNIQFNANTINIINSTNNLNRGYATTINPLNSNSSNDNDDKIKKTSIIIEGKNIDIQIKANKNLYLQELNSKTIHTFKQILLENITNDFIYIKLKNESIKNMLSITDWEYPKLDQLYTYLNNSFVYTFVALFFFITSLFFHANDVVLYFKIKEDLSTGTYSNIRYINIYKSYGNFENGVTQSRFYLYLITSIILYIFMVERATYRKWSKGSYILISYILSILFWVLNLVYIILSIILIVFSILSVIAEGDYSEQYNDNYQKKPNDDFLVTSFILQAIIGFIFIIDFYKLFAVSLALYNYVSMIKNNSSDLNENKTLNENEIGQNEIHYLGLDSIQHTLYEYQIEGHPRYLYYSLRNENNNENNNIIFKNNEKVENVDIINSKNELIVVQPKNNNELIALKNKGNN